MSASHRTVRTFDEVEHGKPVIIQAYHGTDSDRAEKIKQSGFAFGKEHQRHGFSEHGKKRLGNRDHLIGDGVYFADSKNEAGKYGSSVLKVQVKLNNPYVIHHGYAADFRALNPEALKAQGHDGIVVKRGRYGIHGGGENYRQGVAFDHKAVSHVEKWDSIKELRTGAKVRHVETGERGNVKGVRELPAEHKEWRRQNVPDEKPFNAHVHVHWAGSKKHGLKARTDYNVKDHEVEVVESAAPLALGFKKNIRHFMSDYHDQTQANPMDSKQRLFGSGDHFTIAEVRPLMDGNSQRVHVNWLQASKAGAGLGRHALKSLTDLADKHRVHLSLHPARPPGYRTPGLNDKQLKDWYSRHGFSRPYYGEMRRKPKVSESANELIRARLESEAVPRNYGSRYRI